MKLNYTFAALAFALTLTALPSCKIQPIERNLYLECKIGNTPSFTYDQPSTSIYEVDGKWKIKDDYDVIGIYKQKPGELCLVVRRNGESFEQ
jgi:hypothetical protein